MKKFAYLLMFVAVALLSAVSCTEYDPATPEGPVIDPATQGVYVLNSGMWNSNNSELTYIDFSTSNVSTKVFELTNGKKMGDTANDMVVYGKKMYIAVTVSGVVFVTDLKGRILQEIKVAGENANMSPKMLEAANGKVYVTYSEGYLGEIDTTNYSVKTVEVGPAPVGVAYSNKKLYVANSDGYNTTQYGTTVSVVDPASFKVIKTIEVAENPQTFHAATNNKLYLISWGNYADVSSQLQVINTSTDEVSVVGGVAPTNMAVDKASGVAYILSSTYDENWIQTIEYLIYDIRKDDIVGSLTDSKTVPNGYCIFVDEVSRVVWIGTSDYVNNGEVYALSPDGTVISSFDTGAINPICIRFVRN